MKQKRDAGVTGSSSNSARPPRKTKNGGGGKKSSSIRASIEKSKTPNLTAVRVAQIISQLDNKRGSTMDSIRSKLVRSGIKTSSKLIRNALERAVKTGLLREIREERFSLPSNRSQSITNSSAASTSRTTARKVASRGKQRKLTVSSLRCSRRRRRPPQGRRPASSDNGADEDDDMRDMHDDNDTGVGEGDVEAESSGNVAKNPTGSHESVAEPVAGCDAVMVFGTH